VGVDLATGWRLPLAYRTFHRFATRLDRFGDPDQSAQ
jgi:hypothetical protein